MGLEDMGLHVFYHRQLIPCLGILVHTECQPKADHHTSKSFPPHRRGQESEGK